ncbi:MAG TPA: hypothetical protein VFK88_04345, partial [Gallionella sp.]|nr:hypothetical protein [Gallionella sp.]
PLLVLLLIVATRLERTYSSGTLALFLVCAILAVSPWTVRNTLLFGKIVPVATNSGENLLMGNSINARPNSGANVDMSPYARPDLSSMGEVERDTYLRNAAIGWITEHPADAFQLYLRKTLNYFNYRNELSTTTQTSSFREAVLFVTYYPLLALAIVRLFWWRRYPMAWQEVVLYGLYVGSAFASAIFFTRIRYRIPFDALLIAAVAIFVGHLTRQYLQRTSPGKFRTFRAGL